MSLSNQYELFFFRELLAKGASRNGEVTLDELESDVTLGHLIVRLQHDRCHVNISESTNLSPLFFERARAKVRLAK